MNNSEKIMKLKEYSLANVDKQFSEFMKRLVDDDFIFTVNETGDFRHIQLILDETSALINIFFTDELSEDTETELYFQLLDSAGYENYSELDSYISKYYVTILNEDSDENIVSYKDLQLIKQEFKGGNE